MLIALVMEGRPRHMLTLQGESVDHSLCTGQSASVTDSKAAVMNGIYGIQSRFLDNSNI